MLKGVGCKGGVIHFDVQFEVIKEIVLSQEGDTCGRVKIVLVFGGLHGLGLKEKFACKADRACVIECLVKKHREMIPFPFHICIEQGQVSLTATPEDNMFSSEFEGCIQDPLYCTGGVGEYMEIRIGHSPIHVPRMGKEIGCAPEQPDSG